MTKMAGQKSEKRSSKKDEVAGEKVYTRPAGEHVMLRNDEEKDTAGSWRVSNVDMVSKDM
jgi:hypothetical protein